MFSEQMYGQIDRSACVCAQSLSHVQLFVTPETVARQVALSMEFSRQGYWSGLPFPSPGDLTDPGIEPTSLALAGKFFTVETLRGTPILKGTSAKTSVNIITIFLT